LEVSHEVVETVEIEVLIALFAEKVDLKGRVDLVLALEAWKGGEFIWLVAQIFMVLLSFKWCCSVLYGIAQIYTMLLRLIRCCSDLYGVAQFLQYIFSINCSLSTLTLFVIDVVIVLTAFALFRLLHLNSTLSPPSVAKDFLHLFKRIQKITTKILHLKSSTHFISDAAQSKTFTVRSKKVVIRSGHNWETWSHTATHTHIERDCQSGGGGENIFSSFFKGGMSLFKHNEAQQRDTYETLLHWLLLLLLIVFVAFGCSIIMRAAIKILRLCLR
jgi:hypothetical protein